VGAAASVVTLKRRVEIATMPDFSAYRAFLPDNPLDEPDLEVLIGKTSQIMEKHMTHLARLAGAGSSDSVNITVNRENRLVYLNDGSKLLLGVSLSFFAEMGGDSV
jgi:hypothetical protein